MTARRENQMYRQGDVLIVPVGHVPASAKSRKTGTRVVLAEGEVTGHAHTVSAVDAELFVDEVEMYLKVNTETGLTHEEHATITLPPGDYKIVRQREYSPEAIRQVAD
jgi:hypothetical protein